ncbi:hypothetical protein [Actinacidiphila guanduensis]|nr:hypothetical protein [Actinacidiphila guanduensis]
MSVSAGMDEVEGDLGVRGPVRGAGVLAAGELSVLAVAVPWAFVSRWW